MMGLSCLSRYTYRIRSRPSLVGARVNHPQLGEGVIAASLGAPDAVVMAKVAALRRVCGLRLAGADLIEGFPAEQALPWKCR